MWGTEPPAVVKEETDDEYEEAVISDNEMEVEIEEAEEEEEMGMDEDEEDEEQEEDEPEENEEDEEEDLDPRFVRQMGALIKAMKTGTSGKDTADYVLQGRKHNPPMFEGGPNPLALDDWI